MKHPIKPAAQQGFTLIELLLVAIILGILAAVVVPQFSTTSSDTKNQALKANLATLRSAIDLYTQQHKGIYPAINDTTGATSATPDKDDFIAQLTKFSDENGKTADAKNTAATPPIIYGPYLRAIPVEPVSNSAEITAIAGDLGDAPSAAGIGWYYVATVGRIMKNSNAADAPGSTTTYDKY